MTARKPRVSVKARRVSSCKAGLDEITWSVSLSTVHKWQMKVVNMVKKDYTKFKFKLVNLNTKVSM